MSLQKLPSNLNMSELFLDVKLTAVGGAPNKKTDFTGKNTFSVGMWRDNIGFGITDINIEISTSLQPIVDITFKDMYGNATFGVLKKVGRPGINTIKQAQNVTEVDYSVLFDWPPPKFHLTFKGYLGSPVTWILNLKKTTTQNNPTDGSFTIKATFVPNQWGFFADLPFLYLHAVKKLKEDRLLGSKNLSLEDRKKFEDKATTIFDLIKIGKRVEFKQKDVTKEYDRLLKQLSLLKTNAIDGLLSQTFKFDDNIDGKVPGRETIVGFKGFEIKAHLDFTVTDNSKLSEQIKTIRANTEVTLTENRKILALVSNPNFASNLSENDRRIFNKIGPTVFSDKGAENLRIASLQGQKIIDDNVKEVEKEINRRFFTSNKEQLGRITISEIFSRLAGDAAFILGEILQAGEIGFNNPAFRQRRIDSSELIGKYFPLIAEKEGSKGEVPAKEFGIEEEGAEMDFVRKFISAISEGIAKNRVEEGGNDLSEENKLVQRINNLEILSNNPYAGGDVKTITENILLRSGVAAFLTRSFDPNQPGDYPAEGLTGDIDNDSRDEIRQLADKELKNITDEIILSLEKTELLRLSKFCKFFNKLLHSDGDSLIKLDDEGNEEEGNAINGNTRTGLESVLNYDVVMETTRNTEGPDGVPVTNTLTINGEIIDAQFSIAGEGVIKVRNFFNEFKDTSNNRSIFYVNGSPNGIASINFDTFTGNYIFNNGLLYTIPNALGDNKYQYVLFNNPNDISRLDSIMNNDSDSQFTSDDDKNSDEPLGIVKVTNADPNGDTNTDVDRLNTVNDRIGDSFVADYSKVSVSNGLIQIPPSDINSAKKDSILVPSQDVITKDNIGNGKSYIIYTHPVSNGEVGIPGTFNRVDLVWGLFTSGDDNRGRSQRVFLKRICQSLETRINQLEDEKNNVLTQVLGKASSNEDSIYRQMHHIFHQWQVVGKQFNGEDNKNPPETPLSLMLDEEYSRIAEVDSAGNIIGTKRAGELNDQVTPLNPSSSEETITAVFRYDYPIERINPPGVGITPTRVERSVVNIEPLYTPNANTTILNIIQQICTKNNFLFIPIPGNADYTKITDIFQPQGPIGKPKVGNIFHVLFTPTPESRSKFNDDKTPIAFKLPDNTAINAFEINFGSPDNAVIKSIQASTEDNKPTAESILNLQRLVDKDNSNKTITSDCSMLSVMEGRSYRMSVETLGNAQISPMQFFIVKNSPLFGGLYQVMKVTHSITPNDMNTSFEGMKMRFDNANTVASSIKPITLDSLEGLGQPASVVQPTVSAGGENSPNQASNTSESIHPSPETITPSADLRIIQFPLKNGYFSTQIFPKVQIYLHHTAGNANPFDVVRDWNSRQKVGAFGVATAYVIGGKPSRSTDEWKDGDIIQCFPDDRKAYHLGLQNSHFSNQSVPYKDLQNGSLGIEVCNFGQLTLGNDGKFRTYVNSVIPSDEVIKLSSPYRGFIYYHKYTDAQIESLRKLIEFLTDKHKIPKTFISTMFEISRDALLGKPGIWAHASVRPDKVDITPQPKLIEMLRALA